MINNVELFVWLASEVTYFISFGLLAFETGTEFDLQWSCYVSSEFSLKSPFSQKKGSIAFF